MVSELRIELSEAGADAARLEELASYLRTELLELDVTSVTRLRAGPAPQHSKGLDTNVVGGLLVTATQLGADLPPMIAVVRRWLSRGEPQAPRTVRIELDGDVLEIRAATEGQQDQLIELFVERHRPGKETR